MRIPVHTGFASLVGSVLIRLLGVTWRLEWRGEEHLERARRMSSRVIYAFWHGRLLVLSFSHRHRGIHVLASEHRDGDLMGRTIEWLGFGHLKGSSSRGGARALRELAQVLKSGLDVGLTVDGPRGPRGVMQQGAIELSRMTESVIVPVSNSARPRHLFSSWDRFQLPGLCARVVISYGEPLLIAADTDSEERTRLTSVLQERLNSLTAELDSFLGYRGSEVWPHENC